MEELKSNFDNGKYNSIPVFYCKNCLSLRIRGIEDEDSDYCDECGSTDIGTMLIEDWEKLYEEKYGYKFSEKDKLINN